MSLVQLGPGEASDSTLIFPQELQRNLRLCSYGIALMDMQQLDLASRDLLSSAIVGGDWIEHLEAMTKMMNVMGGGPARTVVPNLYALPTSGIRDLFVAFRKGGCPPLTRSVSLPVSIEQNFVADHMTHIVEKRRHEPFYSEFLRPNRACHQAAAYLDQTDAGDVRLLLFRDERQGQFELEDLERFDRCLPYLRSAAMVSRGMLRTMARSQAEPFDRRGEPILYLGPDGRFVEMNDHALRRTGRAFRLENRRVLAIWQNDQIRLDRALTRSLVEGVPGLINLQDREDRPSTMALVLPIAGNARDVFHAISTIIVFIDPTRRQDASDVVIGLLNEAAGLTGRELDVVRLVGMGRSPQDAADDLGIGYGTLRNHLKGGFAKLGVHTQGELVALIQRLR